MKHTPEVLEVKPIAIEFTDDGNLIGTLDIEIKADSISFPEMKNIAQLYKVAPDLLEALKEALPPEDHSGWWCPTCKCAVPGKEVTFEEYHESCGTYLGNYQPETWADKAREIIAKTEGK